MMITRLVEEGQWLEAGRCLLESEWSPAVDMRETKDEVIVRAELPGISKEAIEVTVKDGLLLIKGEKKESQESREGGILDSERIYGRFFRALALPTPVERDQAKATFQNGVLELIFPKSEASKSKKIPIG